MESAASEQADTGPSTVELAGMLNIATSHRQHERYHSLHSLERAVQLRRYSNVLKVVADRWLRRDTDTDAGPGGAGFAAAGCADLNDPTTVATTGVLFMQGEAEPPELTEIRDYIAAFAESLQRNSRWLAEKMETSWPREEALLDPRFADLVRPRFMALTRTTMTGHAQGTAARLLHAATRTLRAQDLTPSGIRADRAAAARTFRTASWLVDMAAVLIAEEGASIGLSDPDWTSYIQTVEQLAHPNENTADTTEAFR